MKGSIGTATHMIFIGEQQFTKKQLKKMAKVKKRHFKPVNLIQAGINEIVEEKRRREERQKQNKK